MEKPPPLKTLCVDDDTIALKTLKFKLKRLGCEPITAANGEEALEIFENAEIPLVVSDWRMPRIDGFELCQEIRARPRPYYVYFILVTDYDEEGNWKMAMDHGVDDFLGKPVDDHQLGSRLQVARRILGFTERLIELKDFMTVCMYCKSIREEDETWAPLEQYIHGRIGTAFSHGVCPACYQNALSSECLIGGSYTSD